MTTQPQRTKEKTRIVGDVFITLHSNGEANCYDIDSRRIDITLPPCMTEEEIDNAVEGVMAGVLQSMVNVTWDGDDVRQFVHYIDEDKDCYLLGSFADASDIKEEEDTL